MNTRQPKHQPVAKDQSNSGSLFSDILPRVCVGALGAILVYVAYFPTDSVGIEEGDGLWLAALAIGWMVAVGFCVRLPAPGHAKTIPKRSGWLNPSRAIDVSVWAIAGWMMLAAFCNAGVSDLRMGTNEAWWWVTAAALVTTARRVMGSKSNRISFLFVTIVISAGLAVDGLHQNWFSLPETQAEYLADPDRAIRQMGIDAPKNSSTRMVLENRLFDGGPSATFALANSLAAVLVFALTATVGVLRFRWSELSSRHRVGLVLTCILILTAMVATRSRAALIAIMVGAVLLWFMSSGARSDQRFGAGLKAWLAVTATGMLAALGLAMFGNPEWFTQAPASLTFRLQYWRSTWQIVLDHPLFGAGPGNFQSLYDRYRDPSTIEMIVDPHNFLFETMASGGLVALGWLLIVFAAGLHVFRRNQISSAPKPGLDDVAIPNVWRDPVAVGAATMLGLIWFFGSLTLNLPDFQSHRFAIPIAMGMAWAIRGSFAGLSNTNVDRVTASALMALMVHLSVSGGWTIPGIAAIAWIAFAGMVRVHGSETSDTTGRSTLMIGSGLLLLLLLTFMSVRPVAQQRSSIGLAIAAMSDGIPGKADRVLADAVAADRWATSPAMYRSEFLKNELIRGSNRDAARSKYEVSVKDVISRTGQNPSDYRQLAAQRLHLYQVFGKSADVSEAKRLLESALEWSPANQWMVAQLAEIAAAEGEIEYAKRLAHRAWQLSRLGNNNERFLYLQQIYVVQPIGSPPLGNDAAASAIRESAEDRLDRPVE